MMGNSTPLTQAAPLRPRTMKQASTAHAAMAAAVAKSMSSRRAPTKPAAISSAMSSSSIESDDSERAQGAGDPAGIAGSKVPR